MEELVSWFWPEAQIGRYHVIGATIALIAGPVIFLVRKGTMVHRFLGYIYVISMAAVNISALVTYRLSAAPNLFHIFAVISLLTVTPALYCAVRAHQTGRSAYVISHYHFITWSYFGLFAAFLSQVATQMNYVSFYAGISPYLVISIGTAVAAIFASIIIKFQAKRILPRYT